MKTRQELIVNVLAVLRQLGAGQDPEPEDEALVADKIATTLSDLAASKVIYVVDGDEFDDAVFEALSEAIAMNCGPYFGVTPQLSPATQLLGGPEARLKRLASSGPTYAVAQATYY